jgi:hypothetical protein
VAKRLASWLGHGTPQQSYVCTTVPQLGAYAPVLGTLFAVNKVPSRITRQQAALRS